MRDDARPDARTEHDHRPGRRPRPVRRRPRARPLTADQDGARVHRPLHGPDAAQVATVRFLPVLRASCHRLDHRPSTCRPSDGMGLAALAADRGSTRFPRTLRERSMTRNKGAMTVAEAGRRGGATTAQRHGPEFYEQIGKKGGKTTAQRHGSDFYEQIGKQGGQKVKELYGPRFYGRIGKIGGDTVSEKYGHEHFEEIGKKGGQKVAELIARGRQAAG